jgi:hypothetical protein
VNSPFSWAISFRLSNAGSTFVGNYYNPMITKEHHHLMKIGLPNQWCLCAFSAQSLCLLLGCLLIGAGTLKAQTTLMETTIAANPLACHGDSDGQIVFTIAGGIPPYQYAWSTLGNSFVFAQGEMVLPATQLTVGGTLSADAYLLRVEDSEGNVLLDTFQLNEPPPIQILTIDVGNSNCGTDCDGFIAMEVGGGTGMLTTTWNDTEITGPNRTGLCANDYIFVISDENGCTQKGVLPIEGPPALQIETELSMPTCLGAQNGAINVEANGGMGEYAFSWSSGQQAASLSGLAAGNYQVSLTDAGGCSITGSYTLVDGPPLLPNLQINDGCGDGRIVVSTQPINGNLPYTYQWSTGQESAVLYAMSAGDYSLSLQDANGCNATVDFTIDYVAPLLVEASVTAVSCFAAADGQISLLTSGGQPPFSITWSNGANGQELTGLAGGEYLFNLSASGCGLAQLVQLPEPSEISAEVLFVEGNNNTLSATAFISGGTAPYLLEWSTGSTANTVNNLLPETVYTLWVQDANQCTATFDVIARLTTIADEVQGDLISIYPNPTSDLLMLVSTNTAAQAMPYQIFNSNGQLITTGQLNGPESELIDLRAVPAGIYYLRLLVDGQVVLKKVIKN